MKKSISFFSFIAFLVLALSSNTTKMSTFVMTTVGEAPNLPPTPYTYSDIPFPGHIFNDSSPDTIVGYRAGGRLDSTVFDFIEDDIATLGRVLFYDKKLSALEDISCGTCHIQELSFTESKRFSEGISAPTKRNSMHLNDLSWSNAESFSWTMKEEDLSSMILLPLTDENEIGATMEDIKLKLENTEYYPQLFVNAFGDSDVTEDRVVDALVQFISSMTTFNSRFDDELKQGFDGFTDSERLGMEVFEFNCAICHSQGSHSFFGEEIFFEENIVELLPFFFNNGLESDPDDIGAGEWLGEGFSHLFKIPTLRNIELTGPYMHDGQLTTLEDVVDHYSEGVVQNEWSGFFIPGGGFDFSQEEKDGLVDFMETLTDESFLTDVKWSDPFAESLDNEDVMISSISLQPNPTTDRAQITFKNTNSEVVAVSIYSQDGRLMKHEKITGTSYMVDKVDYPEGIYFINLIMGNKKSTQKLIIQ